MIALFATLLAVVTAPYAPVSYACDGTTANFTVTFPYSASTDLAVTSTTSGGVVTTLSLTTDFTTNVVSTTSTAVLTILVPATKCPAGSTLKIARNTALTQPTGFRQQTVFNPATHETAYDRTELQIQEAVNTHSTDNSTLAAKDASQDSAIVNISNSVAALNGTSHTVTDTSSVLAFGSTTARTLTARFADVANSKDWNAKGDGATDDTAAIQAAINSLTAGTVLLPPATYVVSSLTMKSGVWLSLNGATLKMKASAAIGARMLDFTGVTNSGLLGSFTLDGNRANQTNTGNNGQFGVFIGPGSSDIFIQSGYATGFSADSLYIGSAGSTPNGVTIQRWVADQAFRNGVSITNAQNVYFGYLEGRTTNGVAPQAGLDIETNTTADILTNVHIGHLNVHGNTGAGAQFLGQVSGTTLVHGNVTVDRLDSYSNTTDGVLISKMRRLSILSGAISSNTLFGIEIARDVQLLRVNAHVFNSGSRGVSAALSTQTVTSSDWDFSGSAIYDNSQTVANTQDGIRLDSDDVTKLLTRVWGTGIRLFDDQGVPTQRFGFSTGANVTAIEFSAYIAGNGTGAYTLSGPGNIEVQKIFTSVAATYTAIAAASFQVQPVTVTGAVVGDQVSLSPSTALTDGLVYSGFVSTANTVKITIGNFTAGALTPGAITFKVTVTKH